MHSKRGVRLAKFLIPVWVLPLMIYAFREGPPPGRTGAPGEQTCFASGCHQTSTGAFFPDSNAIVLTLSDGMTYTPGVKQRLTIQVTDAAAVVFGFQLSARGPANEQAGVLAPIDATTQVKNLNGIDYIEHTGPREDGMFQFDWTPPAMAIGAITFYVASNAANNNFAPTGDRIHTRSFTIEPAAGGGGPRPAILDNGVVHGATFAVSGDAAPNMFGTVFGTDLVERTENWDTAFVAGRAPTELGGAKVMVNGKRAFISFTGRGQDLGRAFDQINFLYPDDEDRGDVNVTVENANGTSDPVVVNLSTEAPGFFAFDPQGRKFVAAVQNDGSAFVGPEDLFGTAPLAIPMRPAKPGDLIQLFCTGFGPTNPAVPAGQLPQGGERLTGTVTVRVGGMPAEVKFAGLSAFAGLYQIVIVTPNLANGDHELVAEIGGKQTQAGLFVRVAQ